MGHPVERKVLSPLPPARVSYNYESSVLFIDNGKPRVMGEEMARGIHVLHDKDTDDASASAAEIIITSAEHAFKPLADAVLVKHGIDPGPDPWPRPKKGHRDAVITKIRHEEWLLAPFSEATYDAASQTLLVENGQPCTASKEMAQDVHVLYGRDYDGADWLASVGIRIDHAETVLKPFVDAILANHGVKAEKEVAAPEQRP